MKTSATAIVTKRQSFKLEGALVLVRCRAEIQAGRGFHSYLQNWNDVVQCQTFAL